MELNYQLEKIIGEETAKLLVSKMTEEELTELGNKAIAGILEY